MMFGLAAVGTAHGADADLFWDLPVTAGVRQEVDLLGGVDTQARVAGASSSPRFIDQGRAGTSVTPSARPRYLGYNQGGSSSPRRRSGGRRSGGGGGGAVAEDIRIGFGPDGAYRDFSEDGEGGQPIDLGPLFGYVESISMGADVQSRYVYRGFDILSRYAKAGGDRSGGVVTTDLSMTTSKGWKFGVDFIHSLESDYIFPVAVGVPPNARLGSYSELVLTVGKQFSLGGGFYAIIENELIWFPEDDQWDSHFMDVFSAGIGYGADVWEGAKFQVELTGTQFFGQSAAVRGTGLTANAALLQELPGFEAFGQSFGHSLTFDTQLYGDKDFNFEGETGFNALDVGLTYSLGFSGWNLKAKAGYSFSLVDAATDPNKVMRDGLVLTGGASFSF